MDQVVVFIDAGYLFAAGAQLLFKKKVPRSDLVIDVAEVADLLKSAAEKWTGLPLLRINWYDGARRDPHPQHEALSSYPRIKLKLGLINSQGEQKGVDSLIIMDLLTLSKNRAMSAAVLVSGDEDLRLGVQQAQEQGVAVHLLGVEPASKNQSPTLMKEADEHHQWGETELARFLRLAERATSPVVSLATDPVVDPFVKIVEQVKSKFDAATFAVFQQTWDSTRRIPSEIDRKLLGYSKEALGRDITSEEIKKLRDRWLLTMGWTRR